MPAKSIAIVILAFIASPGCTHNQLRRSTLNTSSTLTEMQYQQVLDNLAMFVQNSGSLPFFALNSKGNVQISDSLAANGSLNFSPRAFTTGMLGLGPASRAITENWDLQPTLTPNKLLKMRCLYQAAVGRPSKECPDCTPALAIESTKLCGIPNCFFGWGGKHDIPKDVSYVGSYKGTYVWVTPDKLDSLTRLTLLVLDVATENDTLPSALPIGSAGGGGPGGGGRSFSPFDGTPRLNPYQPSSGIQFFPNSSPR